ncbi:MULTISPECIES: undecaprenyldiphospho-muramoylpentapeptide beta-N-acetylglucosaminyltransferase [Deefgea]|uniref:UDP-N-acetylglucosamine--N-acetylmuramyl-(pentapeptide) pyrophosphoryl-undecaprenol N-acetylglucosamine transferase n=1 Tax=Deefgea chitinilytica TaxID=570276 RepID=A0ABS2CDH0_9NEIS|nr:MULTISPECIES: undecaprenyldiphospho-muramoylpentapeptide beta-N-acetylglucosaminyltransferase [Deefgea]MBM5572184.1 undecaprenyldiphospho-muramoylpentapeptide beta-N-acetylglucosaminyltransferase [Deefgea chitinilytica]MBM9889419.1 undecaprenyldiphospho-muramoylpentapeptide beta-N-acetylglucosaminyltransferase [Deefgea sp. CFH1-16]
MKKRTLLVMAGGTGGHIFPALAVANAVRADGWDVVWLGAKGAMETRVVPPHGIDLVTLDITGVRGKGLWKKLSQPWIQAKALLTALNLIFRRRPDVAIGFGGFTGFPGGVAMRLCWLPLVIHEQNSVAGLTNRVLAKIANRVLFAFPTAFPNQAGCVGNPVREEMNTVLEPETRFAGRSGPLKLLVVGGSLGAQVFNEQLPQALALIPEHLRPVVTHQSGEKHIEALKANYAAVGVKANCVAFIADMAQAYADADWVLCRSGALTVAELACVGAASVLVPFPHAVDDHQTGNAKFLSDAGAGILLPQTASSPEKLAQLIQEITRERCLAMATAARVLAQPHATDAVVAVIKELAE